MQINPDHTFYNKIVCGGTFDSLHEGHKAFLRYAFSLGKFVYITITSDLYTKTHKPHAAPFLERQNNVDLFLKKEGLLNRADIVPIDNVFGITQDSGLPLEAILVTEDTLKGAEAVNKKRKELGLPALIIEVMPRILAETGIPISSSSIRNGIYDSNGNLLVKKKTIQNTSYLPNEIRTILQKPFGELVTKEELEKLDDKKFISVGDVTTRLMHEFGFSPSLCVIDFVIERKKQNTTLKDMGFTGSEKIYRAKNPPSTLTPQLWNSISDAFQ